MFVTILFVLGGLSALMGWSPLALILGITLLANTHPAGSGWWYLGMVLALLVLNVTIVNPKPQQVGAVKPESEWLR